jgi:hypothetical protein
MTQPTETTKKQPSHILYLVEKKDGQEKSEWTKVGATWNNADGKGFNLSFELNGQKFNLTARKFIPRSE